MIQRITEPSFYALLTIGGRRGYSEGVIDREELINALQAIQQELIEKEGIYLSASLTETTIVLDGHVEPHFQLRFINYPRFPMEETIFKEKVEELARSLMDNLEQNRVVVELREETVMFQRSEEVDPGIQTPIK